MNSFKVAASKYEESKAILNSMEKIKSDDSSELLIPITSSLYVPGIIFYSKEKNRRLFTLQDQLCRFFLFLLRCRAR